MGPTIHDLGDGAMFWFFYLALLASVVAMMRSLRPGREVRFYAAYAFATGSVVNLLALSFGWW